MLSVPVVDDDFVSDTEDVLVADSVIEAGSGLENGKAIQHQLGSLFIRMQTLLHVSNSAVQEITDELFDIGEFAHQNIKTVIDNILKDNNCIVEASVVTALPKELQILNPLTSLKGGTFWHGTQKTVIL